MFERQNLTASLREIGVEPGSDAFDALTTAYAEPGRYYHTQTHIAECLRQFSRVRHLASKPGEIEVALWFHDAIYDTNRGDNEEMSARWAESYLTAENADPRAISRIVEMIIATKTHIVQPGDAALLVDIDLGILGASAAAFDAYDAAIRSEYAWVPEEQYKTARVKVLNSFLDRDVIYTTSELRKNFEVHARSNLARKIALLSGLEDQ